MSNATAVYDFTLSGKVTEDEALIKAELQEWCKKWAFQLELSDEGYPHWQGRVSLIKKRRKNELVKALKDGGSVLLCKAHWSVTSKKVALEGDLMYVMKADTRVEGPWSDTDKKPLYVPRQVRDITTLLPFQNTVLADIGVWDTRHINIVYNPVGNNGKSTLLSHIAAHGLGAVLPIVNDAKDLLRMVYAIQSNFYAFDMPKAMKKDQLFGFWSAVECIKDGRAYDDRYCFKQRFFDCPNVWIFTNTLPDKHLMSSDRWNVWTINDDKELEKYKE